MDTVIEMMKHLDIGQLIAIGVMLWFFDWRLDKKMEKRERSRMNK